MVQPINYDFIATAGSQVGKAISDIPANQRADEEYKTKKALLDKQLAQIDVNEQVASDAYYNSIESAANEWDETFGDGKGVVMARKMYPITLVEIGKADPKGGITATFETDEKWKKFLEEKKIEKFRQAPTTLTTEGQAGPEYQPPGTPQVTPARTSADIVPGASYTGGSSVQDMQRSAGNAALQQPRTEFPATAQDMSAQARSMNIDQTPQAKADIQSQQDVEAGMLYTPGQTKSEYGSQAASTGINIGTGAAKELIGATESVKDKATIGIKERQLKLREYDLELQRLRLGYQNKWKKDDLKKGYDTIATGLVDDIAKLQAELKVAKKGTEVKGYDVYGKPEVKYVKDVDSFENIQNLENQLEELNIRQSNLEQEGKKIFLGAGAPVDKPEYTQPAPAASSTQPKKSKFVIKSVR